MPIWKLEFYPAEGQRHSPVDALKGKCNQHEQAKIVRMLASLQELEPVNWPPKWVKNVSGLVQMRSGNFRVYLKVIDKTIVVVHVCRKVAQEAKPSDIETALANLNNYLNE